MGHQYPLDPQQQQQQQQYQSQRNFLHASSRQPVYFDPSHQAARPPARVVQRRPQFYSQPPPSSSLYSQVRPALHAPPPVNAAGAGFYGPPAAYDDDEPAYSPHKFMTMARPPLGASLHHHHPEPVPPMTSFEEAGEYLQDAYEAEQMPLYYQQEYIEQQQQQQQQSLGDYVEVTYQQEVELGYYKNHLPQGAIMQRPSEHLNHELVYAPARQARLPAAPLHQYHHYHHHQQQQQPQQPQQQPQQPTIMHRMVRQQAGAGCYSRYEAARTREGLSDEQAHHQYGGPRPMRAAVHAVPVQNSNGQQLAAPAYYGQTSELNHGPAASSSSQLAADLPLRDHRRATIIMNNDQSAYAGDEPLLRAPPPVGGGLFNVAYGNEPYELQQTEQSSSILSEPNVITSAASRDAPDMTEPPAGAPRAPLLEAAVGEAAALAGPDCTRTIDSFGSNTYECSNVSGLQQQQQQRRRQQQLPACAQGSQEATMQPFEGAYGNMAAPAALGASAGKEQEQSESGGRTLDAAAPNQVAGRLLSNPKTNPQEYLDMSTSGGGGGGNVSQDWLDTICGHLIEHMNNFGICVIDNFLGSIKGELILKEVHRLYSNGRYSKGRLVSNKLREGAPESDASSSATTTSDDNSSSSPSTSPPPPQAEDGGGGGVGGTLAPAGARESRRRLQGTAADATGTIRNDRVIWVDGCEDGCAEINNLIQTLCSVITNSSRLSLYSNNGLDKVNINKRTKAHVACYPGNGTRYIKHVDNPNGDGRVITAIYYLNKKWNTKRDGGLLRMFPAGMDEVANIEPLFDRALFFWSDRRNPHEVLPSYRDRFAITVWYIGESRP